MSNLDGEMISGNFDLKTSNLKLQTSNLNLLNPIRHKQVNVITSAAVAV